MRRGRRDAALRIVVSGTHASGKSTLIGDFAARHPEMAVLPDPFELVDAAGDEPDAGVYLIQLRISAARLLEPVPAAGVIAERGPLDFLAYLAALDALGRPGRDGTMFDRGIDLATRAMAEVDLLVLLPLSRHEGIRVRSDEDPELRAAMDEMLLELSEDPELVAGAALIEIAGERTARLAQLETAVSALAARS